MESLYREDSRRIFASVVRTVRDFDIAEESLQEAFVAAVDAWQSEGIPENPAAWILATACHKAIDTLRRKGRWQHLRMALVEEGRLAGPAKTIQEHEISDDQLRLIFTCCHPAIDPGVQVALTLREVCGLTTEEIARAFLVPVATVAQRIVRGKAKIRHAGIPIEIPSESQLTERLDSVLTVIYLVFTEGYRATSGEHLLRETLSREAIRLGRLVCQLLPDPEAQGLLSLMLIQESRRAARLDSGGDLILLEDQNRELWNQELIGEGVALAQQSMQSGTIGSYTIEAAIAALHAESRGAKETDWAQICLLYRTLFTLNPSPVVELNLAVAIAMDQGPAAGLEQMDALIERGELLDYHFLHAARADLLRRLQRNEEALEAYHAALALAKQEPERRFLLNRIHQLS